jgi:hypothetical protein
VYFFYPETNGRSLEELEVMFSQGDSIMAIVKESKRPLTGGFLPENILEKGEKADEIESTI